MKNKKAILLFVVALIILGLAAVFGFTFLHPQSTKNFELQVGQERNFREPGILDRKHHSFHNDKPLFAVVIYPDAAYVSLNKKARLYITEKNSTIIIQEYRIIEHADLAAEEMPVRNRNWDAGEYSVYFERDDQLILTADFALID